MVMLECDIHTYIHTHAHVRTHTHTHTHTCTYAYTYTYTCTCTYIHVYNAIVEIQPLLEYSREMINILSVTKKLPSFIYS